MGTGRSLLNLHSLHVKHLRAVPPEAKRDEASDPVLSESPSRFASDRLNARMLDLQADALDDKTREATEDGDAMLSLRRAMASVLARQAARLLRGAA